MPLTVAAPDPAACAPAFQALTGLAPLRWQSRLYARLMAGRAALPAALDLPTGLGKTKAMALWLIARAHGADLPRRLVYVVDRRAVVDQATAEAEALAAAAPEVLGMKGLAVSTLRGALADNRKWLEDPAAPAIIVGTIDMIGSRLLFEGYGVSRRMRPYHAGLLGADTLVLLDEAHLCPPFAALLAAVAGDPALRPRAPEDAALVPGLHLLALSATRRPEGADGSEDGPEDGPAGGPEDGPADETVFGLEAEDAGDPVVAERLAAAKHLRVRALGDAKLDDALAEEALRLGALEDDGGSRRVLVFSTSRKVAQKVADLLRKAHPGADAVRLLTGARRGRERDGLAADLARLGWLGGGGAPPPGGGPRFLVATAAGEVGVDLDADHMTGDLVAFDRLVQRLGRVNRRGGAGRVAMVTLFADPDAEPAWRAAVEALPRIPVPAAMVVEAEAEAEVEVTAAAAAFDASPAALRALREAHPALVVAATTPAPLHPALDRPTVEAWAMTALRDHPGRPQPAPWLRGWPREAEPPAVTLLWRRHLPWWPQRTASAPDSAMAEAYLAAARPLPGELLETEAAEAARVLTARARALPAEKKGHPALLVFDPARDFRDALTVGAVVGERFLERRLAGGLVVVAAELGGLDDDGLLADKAAEAPPTLDAGWPDDALEQAGLYIAGPGEAGPDHSDWREAFRLAPPGEDRDGTPDPTADLRVYVLRRPGVALTGDAAILRRPQGLGAHLEAVEAAARDLGRALALPEAHAEALALAGRLHDLGKNRPLWQTAMGAPPDDGRPYAKTGGGGNGRLLAGYRHEFGSLRDAEEGADARAAADLAALPDDLRDLVLHLVAAHHGYARPAIAAIDPAAVPSRCAERARAAALRFVRLQERWGPWGLAWWEALLRAADAQASREHDRPGGTGNREAG